tara:strand:- start:66 stop:251 length:186 start_codon:yes stop_codon:yes gene_type:complete
MITLTMKQAETFKTLLTKNKKGTQWLDNKMAKAKTVTTAAPKKLVAKKAVKKTAKKLVSKK